MTDEAIVVENVEDPEMVECIEIFDQELKSCLNKIPELNEVMLEKYQRSPMGSGSNLMEIQLVMEKEGKTATLSIQEAFFEDYIFSNRKERDGMLSKMVEKIRSVL